MFDLQPYLKGAEFIDKSNRLEVISYLITEYWLWFEIDDYINSQNKMTYSPTVMIRFFLNWANQNKILEEIYKLIK